MSPRLLALALVAGCGSPGGDSASTGPAPLDLPTVILDARSGDPGLGSADHLSFGPAGHLFIGDGANDRLVVVQTGDVTLDPTADDWVRIPDLFKKIGNALGADPQDIEINDVTVNPMSGRTYVAAARQDTPFTGVFTVNGDNTVELLDLSGLDWVAVDYPEVQGAGSVVTEIEVTSEWAVAAVTEATWTASQLITLPLPITHGDSPSVTSTNTYHRAHTQWETFAPITTMFSYEDEDGAWIGASYQCAPVVRFDIAELAEGKPETVGVTPYDYGPGRQVWDFAVLGEGTDTVIYASVSNLGGTTVKRSLFLERDDVDELAPIVFDFSAAPAHNKVDRAARLDDMGDIAVQDATRLVRMSLQGDLSIVDAPGL